MCVRRFFTILSVVDKITVDSAVTLLNRKSKKVLPASSGIHSAYMEIMESRFSALPYDSQIAFESLAAVIVS